MENTRDKQWQLYVIVDDIEALKKLSNDLNEGKYKGVKLIVCYHKPFISKKIQEMVDKDVINMVKRC